jgi:hypothetical protein
MAITIGQICDAIESTLGAATGITRSESYDELTDGIHDLPMLQVYPNSGNQDAFTRTDRSTFRGGVRQTDIMIHADLYAQQRAHIGEDMKKLVDVIDAVTNVFEAQDVKPYFGLDGIGAFRWRWERVTFAYGDPQLTYVGARFYIEVRIF